MENFLNALITLISQVVQPQKPQGRQIGIQNVNGQIVPLYDDGTYATQAPISTPQSVQQVQQNPNQFFNFDPHIGPETKRTIYSPPSEDLPLYQKYFPKEATNSAVTAFNESMYNPTAKNVNTKGVYKGTVDRGYFQLNDNTVRDLLDKYPNTMGRIGVANFDDWSTNKWKDKETNFAVAKLLRDKLEDRAGKPAWTSWYGWQDQGFKDVDKVNTKTQ